jgi:hypothetical protein
MDTSIKKYSTQGRPVISIEEPERNTKMQADWMIKSLPPAQQQTTPGATGQKVVQKDLRQMMRQNISKEKKN